MIAAEPHTAAGLKPADEVLIEPVGEGELRLRTGQQVHLSGTNIVARRVHKTRDLVAG